MVSMCFMPQYEHFYCFSDAMMNCALTVAPINNSEIATYDRKKFFVGIL